MNYFLARSRALIDSGFQDVRQALRRLRARRSGMLSVIGVLGVAIGVSTTMFTLVDALLIRPVPFEKPDDLARLYMRGEHGGVRSVHPSTVLAWKRSSVFVSVETATSSAVTIETEAGPVKRRLARVTPGIFSLLGGVRLVGGRLFAPDEGLPGKEDCVLVSEEVWRTLYGASPTFIGSTISVGGSAATVIGIVPSQFRFPDFNTAIWKPYQLDSAAKKPSEDPTVYVRFKTSVPKAAALGVATTVAKESDTAYANQWAEGEPLAALDKDYARAVPLLAGGVAILFALLCANASSLLLMGFAGRRREFEVRSALGASRTRLIGQSLIEIAVACTGAVIVGIGLCWILVALARQVTPRALMVQTLHPLNVDARTLLATSIVGVVAMIIVGLLPIVIGTRVEITSSAHLSERAETETPRTRIAKRVLLAGQVAISCTLLLVAALLLRSFTNLITQDRGIDTSNILVASIIFPQDPFSTPAMRTVAAEALQIHARNLPGVQTISWSYGTPPRGGVNPVGDWTSDVQGAQPVKMMVDRFSVDDAFLTLYHLPILRGRSFESTDEPSAVLVSDSFARTLWPDGDAVGHTFLFGTYRSRVVGIVRDLHYPTLDKSQIAPQLYFRYRQVTNLAMLSLRCGECPSATLVQQKLAQADPRVNIEDVRPLEDTYEAELIRPRAAATLAATFAATALIAAGTGVFGLLSQSVARRRREFGIRAALGASPNAIRKVVWREAISATLPGMAIGALSAALVAPFLSSLLSNVSIADPLSWIAVLGVLAGSIIAASWRPTREAIRASPSSLLKEG